MVRPLPHGGSETKEKRGHVRVSLPEPGRRSYVADAERRPSQKGDIRSRSGCFFIIHELKAAP